MKIKVALIITTYNWPEALELVLLSVLKQSFLPFEIIIADDGSGEETKAVVDKFKNQFDTPLIHIWHEDEGFRRSAVLNKAIATSKSDYIIQLDGDCIIHENFIEDHTSSIKENTYLFGSRVNIVQDALPDVFENKAINFSFFSKMIKKRMRNLHIPLFSKLYKPTETLSKKIRGCNLSYWKNDFLKINGYNEDMTGWGREDSEMIIRMMNNNIIGQRLRYKAIIYHIWHNESSKEKLDINHQIQNKAISMKLKKCKNGIDKYLNDSK